MGTNIPEWQGSLNTRSASASWVQLRSTTVGTVTVLADSNGQFLVTGIPSGTYALWTGPTQVGPWTQQDNNYVIQLPAKTNVASDFFASNPVPTAGLLPATQVYYLDRPAGSGADDSATMQAKIDACSAAGGGEIWGTGLYTGNINQKDGVVLRGPASLQVPWVKNSFRIAAFATGVVIDTLAGGTTGCSVIGVGVSGLGAGTACKGVRFRHVTRGFIQKVACDNFADEGVVTDSTCIAVTVEDVFAQNCVLNRTRGATTGAVDIDGADNYLSRIEATCSTGGVITSASLFCVGIVIRGANHMVDDVIGEVSDRGVVVLGSLHRIVNSRADINSGHGWDLYCSNSMFTNCLGSANSQDTTNTYDNWRADSTSGANTLTTCIGYDPNAKKAKYGFEDLVTSASGKNQYVNCFSSTAVTQQYLSQANNGSSFSFPSGGFKTLAANSATPDVTGFERFVTGNTVPTTITNFTGGVEGQRILVIIADTNTTIQHNGANIIHQGSGDRKRQGATNGEMIEYVKNGAWREVSQYPLGVSADNGDAAKSIQTKLSEETQVWATALTANRAVTLSTTGAYNGARFRIVRKASATGASTLDVGTGPLKSLAVGQWCDVEYNGPTTAWMLTAFGSL